MNNTHHLFELKWNNITFYINLIGESDKKWQGSFTKNREQLYQENIIDYLYNC